MVIIYGMVAFKVAYFLFNDGFKDPVIYYDFLKYNIG